MCSLAYLDDIFQYKISKMSSESKFLDFKQCVPHWFLSTFDKSIAWLKHQKYSLWIFLFAVYNTTHTIINYRDDLYE